MARYEHLPIYKQALDVAVHFERLVMAEWRQSSLIKNALELFFSSVD